MRRKWIIITLFLTLLVGGLKSYPVRASKGEESLTFLEEIALLRTDSNIAFTKIANSFISIWKSSPYLLPSRQVQSHHPEIEKLAAELTEGLHTDTEKSKAIYTWVASNIVYDVESYYENPENPRFYSSLETLKNKVALCSGYAHLNAALHRAIGIKTKVVYGEGHGWNEIYLSGRWQEQDPTYGSGGILEDKQEFIPEFNEKYFSSVDQIREGEFPW
jgi:transglutaminase-like putative cysteine protease